VKRHCHLAKECNNLNQLERIIDKLLSDKRWTADCYRYPTPV